MKTAAIVALLLLPAIAAAAEVDASPPGHEIALGLADLKLIMPGDDWEIGQVRRRPDAAGAYYFLTSAKRGLMFSFFMERTMPCKSAASCRGLALTNPAYKQAQNVVLSERGPFSVAQFDLEVSAEPPLKQAHLLAEAFVNDIAVDIHLSRAGPVTPDAAPLYDLLQSVRFN